MPFVYASELSGYGSKTRGMLAAWSGGCDNAITAAVKASDRTAFRQAVADWAKSGQLGRATYATAAEIAAYFARPDVSSFTATMWSSVAAGGSPNVMGQQWPQPTFDVKDPNTDGITTCGEKPQVSNAPAPSPWQRASSSPLAPAAGPSLPPPAYAATYQPAPLPSFEPAYVPPEAAPPRSAVGELMQNKTVLIGGGAVLLLLGVLVIRKLTRAPAQPAYYPPYPPPYYQPPVQPPAQAGPQIQPAAPATKNRRR